MTSTEKLREKKGMGDENDKYRKSRTIERFMTLDYF